MKFFDLKDSLNDILLERVKDEYNHYLELYKKDSFEEQMEGTHTLFWFQEIVYYFETHQVRSEEAFALLTKAEILEYLLDRWLDKYSDDVAEFFNAFMGMETSLTAMKLESEE